LLLCLVVGVGLGWNKGRREMMDEDGVCRGYLFVFLVFFLTTRVSVCDRQGLRGERRNLVS